MNLIVTTKKYFSTILKHTSGSISTNQKQAPHFESTPVREILIITETFEREANKEGFFRCFIKRINDLLTLVKFIELLYKGYRYRHFIMKTLLIIVTTLSGDSFWCYNGSSL